MVVLGDVHVVCAAGATVEQLAAAVPHGQVGVTTVGRIRQLGGDVARTTGRSPNHATVSGLTPEQASRLLTPTRPNPARRESGRD